MKEHDQQLGGPIGSNAAACALLLALFAASSGCSLLLDFDEAGLPCDATNACLEGFVCQAGRCVAAPDAQVGCPACPMGFQCDPLSAQCVAQTCSQRACPAGERCIADGGPAHCEPIMPPASGHPCTQDSECTGTDGGVRVCLLSAIQDPQTGALRGGICVEPCAGSESTCEEEGALCVPLPGAVADGGTFACLSQSTVTPCADDRRCASDGLVCTVFDHPSLSPTRLCDVPSSGGAVPGAACSATVSDAGAPPLCSNGLCGPQNPAPGAQPTCLSPCTGSDCATGVCAVTEFALGGVVRHLPLCVPQVTRCEPCDGAPEACGADSPRCSTLDGGAICLSACSPDAGAGPACPGDDTCVELPEGPRCVPPSGACP